MPPTIHQIDSEDIIIHVDEVWLVFGRANWINRLTAKDIVGTSLWEFISGVDAIHLWKNLLAAVRKSAKSVSLPYRCDSPQTKRYMSMSIVPLSDGIIEFSNVG